MKRQRTHFMFAELRAHLSHVTGDFPGKILCPLCLKPMPEEWIDLEEPLVTEEHVIPEKLGGTVITLTCKDCNSTHGTKLDSQLIQMIRSQDSLAGVGTKPLDGRMQLDGKPLPVNINLNASAKTIRFEMRPSHPAVPDQVRQFFRDNLASPDSSVIIRFEGNLGYIQCRAELALLRIGYLATFRQWGYGYILSPAAEVIRRIVMNYKNPPVELERIILGNISPAPAGPLQFVLLKGGLAVLVVMTLVAETKPYYYGVVMPSYDLKPGDVFHTLLNATGALLRRTSTS